MNVVKVDFRKLQQAKAEKKLSDYKIAERSGGQIQAPTVRKIIRGDHTPSAVNLKHICDVLEIPIQEVFTEAAA